MGGFIEGACRSQATLFADRLDDYVSEENPVRVIDAFIDSLELSNLGFKTVPAETCRPAYHQSTMLKLFVYGYLNRIQSSRRLEREAGRWHPHSGKDSLAQETTVRIEDLRSRSESAPGQAAIHYRSRFPVAENTGDDQSCLL